MKMMLLNLTLSKILTMLTFNSSSRSWIFFSASSALPRVRSKSTYDDGRTTMLVRDLEKKEKKKRKTDGEKKRKKERKKDRSTNLES